MNAQKNIQPLTCIGCPMGCALTVTQNGGAVNVSGNDCKIGERYANEEITNPTRNIAASVKIAFGKFHMLSVKTQRPIPKNKIADCMKAVRGLVVEAPVNTGDVIIANAAGTGVNMVATRDVARVT